MKHTTCLPVEPSMSMAKAFRDADKNGERFLDGYAAMIRAADMGRGDAPEDAREKADLLAELERLHDALCFWLPQSHAGLPDAMAERIAADAYLLVGYDDMPDPKSAEELGWITTALAAPQVEQAAPAVERK